MAVDEKPLKKKGGFTEGWITGGAHFFRVFLMGFVHSTRIHTSRFADSRHLER